MDKAALRFFVERVILIKIRYHQIHHQQQPGEQFFSPYRLPASLILNIFLYLLSIFISNKNNKTYPHTASKTIKEPIKQKSGLGTTSNKITGGLHQFALDSPPPPPIDPYGLGDSWRREPPFSPSKRNMKCPGADTFSIAGPTKGRHYV